MRFQMKRLRNDEFFPSGTVAALAIGALFGGTLVFSVVCLLSH